MKKLLITVSSILAACLSLMPAPVQAQGVDDFIINDFYGRYELFNDAPAGRMDVTETIELNYSGQNRGILRALPKSHRGVDHQISVGQVLRDGSAEQYITYKDSNGNFVIRIGNPDVYITGPHTYEINYTINRGAVSFYEDRTEWYWDINGLGWGQAFESVRGEVILPETDISGLDHACYTGTQGSTLQNCMIEPTDRGFRFSTVKRLDGGETLTVAVQVPDGFFRPYTWTDWMQDNIWQLLGVLGGIVVASIGLRLWWRYGRDYEGRGTIVPHYEPPKGITPTEAGLLADYTVHGRDVSAAIIDLAVKGYLVIRNDQKKYLGFVKVNDFSFELINNDTKNLKKHEVHALKMIFGELNTGAKKKLKDINRTSASTMFNLLKSELSVELTKENGYFEPKGKTMSITMGVVGLSAFPIAFIALMVLGWGWFVGGLIGGLSLASLAVLMPRRSHAGVEAYEKIKGLELYMKTAEADRLKMMQSVDSPYAEPEKTYHLFEKLLPYAVALGVERSWARQFEGVFDKAPDWYQGSGAHNINAIHFASSLTSDLSALNRSFSTQSSSSSSGSGGGGSAGGGGGGGGGGW